MKKHGSVSGSDRSDSTGLFPSDSSFVVHPYKKMLTSVIVSVFGASGTGHSTGLVPDPGSSAGTTHYLREDATWAIPSVSVMSGANALTRIP